ncbi:MAG: HAD family phosphatase [Gemmatimonadaceae bacterium]|jgi:HAD superfamily hydrolase (TIGR01509 family)|nr:HAD family phosphatase [Gemmatimonadaceae bacterium]
MTRHIKAVVFDMDGLLLDTERLSRQAWLAGGRDLGVELPLTALTSIIGRRRPEVEAEFRAAMGESFAVDALYERHAAHYHALLAATPAHELRKPGLDALLHFLDVHAIPRAIATSTLAAGAAHKLALAELAPRFPIVVTGEQVARSKPAPDIFLEAARRLQVNPADCVAFEDSDLGLDAALAAGMLAIAVPDLKPLPSTMMSRVAATLGALDEAMDWLAPRLVRPTT